MNPTHLEHALIGLGIQCLLWPIVGRRIAGSLIVAVFLGREIAQHEYAGGGPNHVAYFYGLLHHWSLDSALDVLSPAVACALLALLVPGSALWRGPGRQRRPTPSFNPARLGKKTLGKASGQRDTDDHQ